MTTAFLGSRLVRQWRWLLPLLLLVLLTSSAWARVGGGQSYSGGGGGGGGGGGSGDGGGLELLLWIIIELGQLTVNYPAVGVPLDLLLLGALIGVVYYRTTHAVPNRGYSSQEAQISGRKQVAASDRGFDTLRKHDPNFSRVLFEDFVYTLYATAQEARGRKDLQTYAPYLGPRAIAALEERSRPGLTRVSGIIVAAARVLNVSNPDAKTIAVVVEFEANYTETFDGNRQTTWYVRERWQFRRAAAVLSRPPETITALHCPKCGGALERGPDGACRHCGVKITGGNFDWFVVGLALASSENKGPLLTQTVPEEGTDLPTVYHPQLAALRARFLALNPGFDWGQTTRRATHIFLTLQQSWSDRTWDQARPYVSDCLFQMLDYWISEYRRQHLRNVLEDVQVESLQVVKIAQDAFYDALTFRIVAHMRDYTTDEAGKLICGSKDTPRRFSEYWTFIRRRGVSNKSRDDAHCPNCGAALKVNMAGVCEYCHGKITRGDFDWVLSRIEQDEAYRG